MTEIIRGLDEITDYSENFINGKEDFYDVLSNIGKTDIISIFETKDNKKCVFTSGYNEESTKEFLLYIDDEYINILKHLYFTYIEFYTKKILQNTDIYDKGLDSLTLLSAGIIALTNININDVSDEILTNGIEN